MKALCPRPWGMAGRPGLAEEMALVRDLALVRATGVRYHVQHITTAGAVDLVAAVKAEGLEVTAEVTPHHLYFDDEAVRNTDPVFKMNPPLRPRADRDAVRRGLADGVIDAVATDHAPHAVFEKDVPFEEAPPGVIGLETAAAAVVTAVDLSPEQLFDRLAVRPARIAGLERQGHLVAPGAPANLTVFDPAAEWSPEAFVSKSANSPFRGETLRGRVATTIVEGVPAGAPVTT